MQTSKTCHSQLTIPLPGVAANVEKYVVNQFRRTLENWAFDLLTKNRPKIEAIEQVRMKKAA
jgi:hypothetical protein